MSESDGIEDVLDGGLRQSLMIASRIAETLARRRQETQRQNEHQDAQAAHEAQARLTAERSAARAALAPVEKDQWWDKAQPADIATVHAVAEGVERPRPGCSGGGGDDPEASPHPLRDRHPRRRHGRRRTWPPASRPSALTRRAGRRSPNTKRPWTSSPLPGPKNSAPRPSQLAPEMERHQVPVEYLTNPALAQALQSAHTARTPAAIEAADTSVKERLYLIGKDGINGPTIDQLREETTANFNGVREDHFHNAKFVDAAKEWHEVKLLAEGGFTGSQGQPLEQRYERTEAELFARIEAMGRELEHSVTGDDSKRLGDQGVKAENSSAAEYGSADHHQAFAASLAGTASEERVKGRLAAARSEGTHPSAALAPGKAPAKARKTTSGASLGAQKSRSGPSR